MNQRSRAYVAGAATIVMFLLVQLGALALVEPFEAAGLQTVENPSDPTNSLLYVGVLLVFTGLMLVAIKLSAEWVLRAFIIFTSGMISLYVFSVVVPPLVTVPVDGASVNVFAWAGAVGVAVALLVHPEWYVIDAAGVVMGAGAAGLFGISFGILPAIVLLSVLAVYDAISVYGTEHMLTLASGVMNLKVPVILVVPLTLSYSFKDEVANEEGGETARGIEDEGEATDASDESAVRDAFFIGLGDAVMPTVMVASAAFFVTAAPDVTVLGLTVNVPALTAMVGTMAGLVALLVMVMKGRAHAGLPLLNGGAIGGYIVGALASGIPLLEALGVATYL